MKPTCEICGAPAELTLDKCVRGFSVTSDSRLTKTVSSNLYCCSSCDYYFTRTEFDADGYYDETYNLLLDEFEQDQLLYLPDGTSMLRNSYQASLLNDLTSDLDVSQACDIGCGKGLTSYHFLNLRGAVQLSLYDPGHAIYKKFWQAHLPLARPVTLLETDTARFDLVFSFFAAEHVPDMREFVSDALSRLNSQGVFVACIPDLEQNFGDLLVSDHLRHLNLNSAQKIVAQLTPQGLKAKVWRDGPLRAVFFAIGAPDAIGKLNVPQETPRKTVDQPDLSTFWPITRRAEILDQIGSRKIVLWGGSFYARVLDLTLGLELTAVVDSNPHFRGGQFDTISGQSLTIQSPDSLDALSSDEMVIIPCMTPQASLGLMNSVDARFRASMLRVFS